MFMILMLIVFVVVLNIIFGLIMLVKDKGYDIVILWIMGVIFGVVMCIFFMMGVVIGMMGIFVGFVFGVVVCFNVECIW